MKSITKCTLAGLSLFLMPFENLTADLPEHSSNNAPVAIKIDAPGVSRSQVGHEVRMVFKIKANGHTTDIHSKEAFPDAQDLAAVMANVIRFWKFKPALNKEGKAISVSVELPVKVVGPEQGNLAFAAIKL